MKRLSAAKSDLENRLKDRVGEDEKGGGCKWKKEKIARLTIYADPLYIFLDCSNENWIMGVFIVKEKPSKL